MKVNITPLMQPLDADINLPGSKSIVNRVLLMAALAKGRTRLSNLLFSADTQAMLAGLESLGIIFTLDRESATIEIEGSNGQFPNQNASVFCDESGTMTRFIIPALAAQQSGVFHVDGAPRMRERPIKACLAGLEKLGAEFEFHGTPYQMPLTIHARGLRGKELELPIHESTQILSGIAMAAVLCDGKVTCRAQPTFPEKSQIVSCAFDSDSSGNMAPNLTSKPYIQMTVDLMRLFGADIHSSETVVTVNPKGYEAVEYTIEPDLSTSSYFAAAAALTGGIARVHHVPQKPLQGDIQFYGVLEAMGCEVFHEHNIITVKGPDQLKGISVNMRNFSDTFMTLSALAPFADSPTHITGLAHTRLQESDRIEAIATGLKTLHAKVETSLDGISIYPSALRGGVVSGCGDHRIAMSLGLIGLVIEGVEVQGAECVAKTCPDYFERLTPTLLCLR